MRPDVHDPPKLSVFAKRGLLYGAALGMLAGLVYEATVGAAPAHPVVVWRNFILAGALLGLIVGFAVGLFIRRRAESTHGDGE